MRGEFLDAGAQDQPRQPATHTENDQEITESVHDYSKRPLCADCGVDTTPCRWERVPIVWRFARRKILRANGLCVLGCDHDGRWEWYGVRDEVWADAQAQPHIVLCIGCLEARLGRELVPADFSDYEINEPNWWDTPRLAARKGQSWQ